MKRVFGAKKNKEPLPTITDATDRINKRGEGVDEKIKKLDAELARYKEQIKKTRPGAAQEADKARAMRVLKQKRIFQGKTAMTVPARVPFYATLLDSIFCARDVRALCRAHAVMLAAGVAHHDLLRTKLSACYAQCGCFREARHIFARANRRPAFLYNTLIRAYADRGLYLPSVAHYREMALEGKPPDPRALASALRSCAALASLRLGRLLHAAAFVEGLSSEVVVVNSLVAMYAKCGDIASARNLFDGMPHRTVVSWTAMIAGLGAHGRAEHALELFDEMLGTGERPDAKAITAVLASCSHGGLVEAGERLFRGMEERFGVRPTVEHFTCMVDLLGRAGRVEDAEALVGEMEEAPEALWGALLAACRAQGKLDVALRVARKVYSVEPDADKPKILYFSRGGGVETILKD